MQNTNFVIKKTIALNRRVIITNYIYKFKHDAVENFQPISKLGAKLKTFHSQRITCQIFKTIDKSIGDIAFEYNVNEIRNAKKLLKMPKRLFPPAELTHFPPKRRLFSPFSLCALFGSKVSILVFLFPFVCLE